MIKFIYRLFRSVLMLSGIVSFTRCSSGYKKDGDKVLFNGKEVDKDLKILNKVFAKNDSTVFFKEYPVTGAAISSFTALDEHYAKDRNTVYYCDEYREGQNYYLTKRTTVDRVKNADPASFSVIESGYAKDKIRAYSEGIGFAVKDVATIEVINGRFIKDKTGVYFEKAPVQGSDAASFRVVNNNYAQDTAHIYYYGYANEADNGIHIIPCSTQSFALLDYPYSKDDAAVFYVYAKINGADPKTFSVLEKGFSKDKQTVFWSTQKLNGADPSSFIILPETDSLSSQEFYYAKDNKYIFWKDKKLSVTNPAAFKILGLGYATDGKHIYFKNLTMQQADVASFKVYPHGFGEADAQDKNNKYYAGARTKVYADADQ